MINRNRADNDSTFKVSIEGVSRARWSLVIDALSDWLEQSKDVGNLETLDAVSKVIDALDSHVIGNYDGVGYSSFNAPPPKALSEAELHSLERVRNRCAEAKSASESLAKELGFAQRKIKHAASKAIITKRP